MLIKSYQKFLKELINFIIYIISKKYLTVFECINEMTYE
jgi:hypothetical protein